MTEQETKQVIGGLFVERTDLRKKLAAIDCKLTRAQGLAREFIDNIEAWKGPGNRIVNHDHLSELSQHVSDIGTTFDERSKLKLRLDELEKRLGEYDR
ncbi:MAG: hypothetical protein OXE54_09755 [Gammaproteobacteria bacterium]|nr:hypothetical protein [Gammaproteobacteria bacterium]